MSQTLKTLFNSDLQLLPLLSKVQALSSLQHHFINVIPTQFVHSVQVLGLQYGQLSIAASNAAVAAKLRQLAPELALLMQNRGCEVSGIRVKVQVSYDLPQTQHPPRKLSHTAKQTLQKFSMGLEDSDLKTAIEKISLSKS